MTDKKTIKFVRQAERIIDENSLKNDSGILLANADTQRTFGLLLSIDTWEALVEVDHAKSDALDDALATIEVLEDDNALLDIIDGLNDVLQGRVIWDEAARFADAVGFSPFSKSGESPDVEEKETPLGFSDFPSYEVRESFGAGPIWNPTAGDRKTHEMPPGEKHDQYGRKIDDTPPFEVGDWVTSLYAGLEYRVSSIEKERTIDGSLPFYTDRKREKNGSGLGTPDRYRFFHIDDTDDDGWKFYSVEWMGN